MHGLTYFVEGGTLLGILRNNDYIPWDDDIDIMMMSDDFKSILQIFEQIKLDDDSPQIQKLKNNRTICFANDIIYETNGLIELRKGYYEGYNDFHIQIWLHTESKSTNMTDIFRYESNSNNYPQPKRQLFPIHTMKLRDIYVNVFHNYMEYIEHIYGKDYLHHCKIWNHQPSTKKMNGFCKTLYKKYGVNL